MARKNRIHITGGIYHVILRGNGGARVFFSNKDCFRFNSLLEEGVERFTYRIHAYCLMPNHIHLMIQVGSVSLSKIIHNLSFRYTQYINTKKQRTGHLFQGRFKAILVDADSYTLQLIRYIHNNPVRAKIATSAAAYRWSSHQAYLGAQQCSFLTTDWILGQFGEKVASGRIKFAEFVVEASNEQHRKDFYSGEHDNRILGDDSFVEQVLSHNRPHKKPQLDELIARICHENEVTEGDLAAASRQRKFSVIRGIIGWLTLETEAGTLTQVATRFNRDIATISRAATKIENLRKSSTSLQEQLDALLK